VCIAYRCCASSDRAWANLRTGYESPCPENRLTSVSNPSYTAAYTYSADGLRLRAWPEPAERVQESNAQYTDRWLQPLGPFGAGVAAQRVQPYDGVRPVLEGTLDTEGVFTTLNKYVWEGNGYYDPLVYSLMGGAWRYHMYDGLGSTRQLMLHASPYTITDTYSYEAFGNLMASTGTTPNPYKYVGSLGYYATGSSLMHLGARYYMPEVGRFLQEDPVERESTNLYVYCRNRPTTVADPDGRGPINRLTPWLPPLIDRLRDFCDHSDLCQMLNGENWSSAHDLRGQCYNHCLLCQQLRVGIISGLSSGGGRLSGEGWGVGGFLIGLTASELLALHDCAAQCGYGPPVIPL